MEKKAYVACGCFWGSQALFNKLAGVEHTQVGYMGDNEVTAHYDIVKTGSTHHKETIEITYNPSIISYNSIIKYFFEIHDFTQADGQGPDIGEQYLSVIFYANEEEKSEAEKLISLLKMHNYSVATQVTEVTPFYPAESYHQDYYAHNGLIPYCHIHRPLKDVWYKI